MAEKLKKKPVCTICGKPSAVTVCEPCNAKIRGEFLEKRIEVKRAGKTDSGRR